MTTTNASAHPALDALIQRAAARADKPAIAVIYPCEAQALSACGDIANANIGKLALVGPSTRIRELAGALSLDLSRMTLVDTPDDPKAAAQRAAEMVRDGTADVLMKGSLHTDELMGVLVSREAGLRTARRISHAFYFSLPRYDKPLMLADCVVNITPDLQTKRDIVQNAVDLAHTLSINAPKVAILAATESVNPAMPSTLDATALCKMADRGQITGAILDGPLAFDNAISADAARIKGITSPVAGQPDILIAPNLETGNTLYKSFVYMGGAECAGLVLGARVPVVLTSRADSAYARLASAALGVLAAR